MKRFVTTAILCLFALIFCVSVRADYDEIERLMERLDAIVPKEPTVLTLDECIAIAIENNHDLKVKQHILNSVEGDEMIDRSRFFSHVDVIANFNRGQGSLLKTYAPAHNPMPVGSLGALETSAYSGSASGGGTDISSLASQFGVSDVSSLLSSVPPEYQQLAEQFLGSGAFRVQGGQDGEAGREANQLTPDQIQELIDALSQVDPDQIQDLIDSLEDISDLMSGTSSSSQRTTVTNDLAVRYSRRLVEWGRDSSSSVSIRANRRLATHNYQNELRNVISSVRTTFFQILLNFLIYFPYFLLDLPQFLPLLINVYVLNLLFRKHIKRNVQVIIVLFDLIKRNNARESLYLLEILVNVQYLLYVLIR